MTTARRMIERAFSKAGIKPAESPLSDSEYQDGLDVLNDMLALWDANSVLEGVPLMDNTEDTVDCPRYAEGAIKAGLAIAIAGEYDRAVTQAMAADWTDKFEGLVAANTDLSSIDFPDTLPIGSGNRDSYYSYVDDVFFPQNKVRNF